MPPPDDPQDRNRNPAGRVRHDSTGRAIWEWAASSGRHAIESTSRLLKRLELPGLKVTEYEPKKDEDSTQPARRDGSPGGHRDVPTFGGEREADPLAHGQRSFDPYDNRAPKRGAPLARKPVPPAKPRITQPPPQKRKPGLFARLFGRR